MLKQLKRWLKPPLPSELGRSKTNALPSRMFSPFSKEYCWDDWRKEVRKKYPVRYFLTETFPIWLYSRITGKILDLYWSVKDRLFTKYYLVDIRQGYNNYDFYRVGYIDPVEKILYANFSILKDFIEKERPKRPSEFLNEMDEHDHYWENARNEAYELYDYWMNKRAEEWNKISELAAQKREAINNNDEEKYLELQELVFDARESFEKHEDEMLLRLIKIRKTLWT